MNLGLEAANFFNLHNQRGMTNGAQSIITKSYIDMCEMPTSFLTEVISANTANIGVIYTDRDIAYMLF